MTIRSIAAITAALLASTAGAVDFSFTGTFGQDNDTRSFLFSVTAPTTVTFTTFGYAGGTNAAGDLIAAGGFDPVISVYNSAGDLVADGDDGSTTIDADSGEAADLLLSLDLGIGSYRVFLAQYNNFGPGSLPGEFAFAGEPNFRDGFIDLYGSQRDGDYAFDILGVDNALQAGVPEPASWALMIAGFGLVGGALRRRARLGVVAA